MKNMSFALTTEQMEDGSKEVTRRLGWEDLRPGDRIRACVKCMGLKKGEKLEVLGIIEVLTVRREPLRRMLDEPRYGQRECVREGFPNLTPAQFVEMFCATHKGCTPETIVTRIKFKRLPAGDSHD